MSRELLVDPNEKQCNVRSTTVADSGQDTGCNVIFERVSHLSQNLWAESLIELRFIANSIGISKYPDPHLAILSTRCVSFPYLSQFPYLLNKGTG